jgi:acylphosphatase
MANSGSIHPARIHIWVKGRVQGVGFRSFVMQAASQLGLTGWVRNVGDQTVETVAEGLQSLLEEFAEEVKTGPWNGRVDEARLEWEPAEGIFQDFEVKFSL